jgi:glycosyltransferase involved in cell wall biosynthesis
MVVKEGELEARVHFLGPQKDAKAFLLSADIFVMPSLSEGMSVALLEAMAAGCAVCASDIPANRELIEHETTGLLFESGDEKTLARCLDRLIADGALRNSLGEKARAKVLEDYSLEKMTGSYHNILLRLAGAKRF